MPEICRFYGIVIAMFYADHSPPHFHARYGGHKAVISIGSLTLMDGSMPPRALGMIVEWAAQHQAELERDWELARNSQPPEKIEPLK